VPHRLNTKAEAGYSSLPNKRDRMSFRLSGVKSDFDQGVLSPVEAGQRSSLISALRARRMADDERRMSQTLNPKRHYVK